DDAPSKHAVELSLAGAETGLGFRDLDADIAGCAARGGSLCPSTCGALLERIPRRAMRALALPLEGFPTTFGTHENRAGTGHQGLCKYVSLKFDRCDSSRVWLGCAPAAPIAGFVTPGSDVSRGNASVCRPFRGQGGGSFRGLKC